MTGRKEKGETEEEERGNDRGERKEVVNRGKEGRRL